MGTHKLFEQIRRHAKSPRTYIFGFALYLTNTFDDGDADRVALEITKRSGGDLVEYDPGVAYGEVFTDEDDFALDPIEEGATGIEYHIQSIPIENKTIPQKVLRRLQRGKPRFEIVHASLMLATPQMYRSRRGASIR